MIAICGELGRPPGPAVGPASIATRAAAAGAATQLVGLVPDDPDGDRQLLELAARGVGHAAVLREPPRPLEPADLDLALRYLPELRVIVAVGLPDDVVMAAGAHAAAAGVPLIVIGGPDPGWAEAGDAIVLAAPARDPDETFAGFVGALAARLDGGATPADAWAATTEALAVDPA